MVTENFGDFFRRLRRAKGFRSQKDLAIKSGVSQATLSRIEDGTQTPLAETLKALAHTLDVPYPELMVAAGHWDEEDLLEPLDKEKLISGKKHKENPSASTNVKEFVNNINLTDEELLQQFKLTVDDRELSAQEMKNIIAFVRTLRQS